MLENGFSLGCLSFKLHRLAVRARLFFPPSSYRVTPSAALVHRAILPQKLGRHLLRRLCQRPGPSAGGAQSQTSLGAMGGCANQPQGQGRLRKPGSGAVRARSTSAARQQHVRSTSGARRQQFCRQEQPQGRFLTTKLLPTGS